MIEQNVTVEALDRFMQKETDNNIVNEARNFMKDGTTSVQNCKK